MKTNTRISCILLLALAGGSPLVGCVSSGGGSYEPGMSQRSSGNRAEQIAAERRAASHYNVGTGHLREGRVAMAIRELRISEELRPEDKWTQLALADAYRRKGLFADAERHLLKSLDRAPDFQQARLTLSAIYIELERYGEAIEQTEILVTDPTFPLPWAALTNQGWAYYKLGQVRKAFEVLELATEYHSGYWRPILNLGIIEAERGSQKDAIARFERVVELDPGPLAKAEANFRIAEIYISSGDRIRAVDHLTASAEQQPSGPWGKRSKEYLDRIR